MEGTTVAHARCATRASHFEFHQAFCSGRGAGWSGGEGGRRRGGGEGRGGGCGYGCPRLIFQMSKDRGHEAILLILDVAAVSPLGGRSTSFLPLSILFFSTRFPSLLDFFFLLLVVSFSSIFFLLSKSFFLNRRRFVEVVLRSIFIFDRSAKLKSGAILYFASNDIVKKVADTHAQIRYAILFITGKRVFLYSQSNFRFNIFE